MRTRRLQGTVAALLVLEIGLWLTLFAGAGLFRAGPNGKSMATDFAVFSGAARAIGAGGNPYDTPTLYRHEQALLRSQGLAVTSNVQNVRAGNPPIFYWAIQPLTRLPFQTAAYLWIVALFLCAAAGYLAALKFLGWQHKWIPLILFLLMPQVVLGACYGNIHAVFFAALAGALALVHRFPFAAGGLMTIAWLKPQLGLPIVLLVLLFHTPRPWRALEGFASVSALLLVATLFTTGPQSLVWWAEGLMSWSGTTGLEPNLASLVGLYASAAPVGVSAALRVATLVAASALTGYALFTVRATRPLALGEVAWLWVVWFLAAPFAHFPDEILLTLPVLVLLGRDGLRITGRLAPDGSGQSAQFGAAPIVVLFALFFSIVLFPASIGDTNLLSLIVLAICYVMWRQATKNLVGAGAEWLPASHGLHRAAGGS